MEQFNQNFIVSTCLILIEIFGIFLGAGHPPHWRQEKGRCFYVNIIYLYCKDYD